MTTTVPIPGLPFSDTGATRYDPDDYDAVCPESDSTSPIEVDDYVRDCGEYLMEVISESCALECSPGGLPESELPLMDGRMSRLAVDDSTGLQVAIRSDRLVPHE